MQNQLFHLDLGNSCASGMPAASSGTACDEPAVGQVVLPALSWKFPEVDASENLEGVSPCKHIGHLRG